MSLGKKLSSLRKERNLTQDEFAKALNIGKSTVAMYETDKRTPDAEMLKVLASFYKVTIDYLLDMPENEANIQQVSDALQGDPELQAFWDMLKEREDLQILFKQTKNLDSKGIQQIIRIIKAIEDEEDND